MLPSARRNTTAAPPSTVRGRARPEGSFRGRTFTKLPPVSMFDVPSGLPRCLNTAQLIEAIVDFDVRLSSHEEDMRNIASATTKVCKENIHLKGLVSDHSLRIEALEEFIIKSKESYKDRKCSKS